MTFGVRDLVVCLGSKTVLDQVSVDFPAGEVTALVGGDGAGKTTLLRCASGQVHAVDGSVSRPDKTRLGSMPATSGTWPDLTVDENIDFVRRAHGMATASVSARRDELLERAGLDKARKRLAGDLSGGMRQKLGFVLAVLHEPDLLILDEPSTGVDPVSRVDLWRLIALAAAGGTAVAMATSYLDEAERASSLLVLDRGRALAQGTADEVIDTVPGSVLRVDDPTSPERSWRRGHAIHEWIPAGQAPLDGIPTEPDLEDVLIARMISERIEVPG